MRKLKRNLKETGHAIIFVGTYARADYGSDFVESGVTCGQVFGLNNRYVSTVEKAAIILYTSIRRPLFAITEII